MVLFASYSGAWGGAERLLVDWAPGLGDDVCLACPPGPLAESAERAGLRVFPLTSRSLALRGSVTRRARAVADLAGHRREVERLVGNLDPELLVAWGMRTAIACTARRPRCPVVFHHNDFLPPGPIADLVRRAAGRAELITTPSHAVADDLDPDHRLRERLVVVHPGVDCTRFSVARTATEPPTIVVLGALVPWKRPDLALEACALARRGQPELRLRLVGAPLEEAGGDLMPDLRRRAAQADLAGAVEFAGAVSEPAVELSRATCLLHCAEREPFGMAVLEALAAGVPVVAPDSAGPREIVDASCGILYPPGDAAAAATALETLLSDRPLAEGLGAGGRARAAEGFDGSASRARWAGAVKGITVKGISRARALKGVTGSAGLRARPQEPDPPAITVVTVTHNSGSFLAPLLRSIDRHLPEAAVIVVDSASEDDTVEVAAGFPGVRVLALESNVGFGRACNLGLAEVTTAVSALLNPDTELLDDSLLALAAAAAAPGTPERLLAPLLVGPDGRREDGVHPLPATGPEVLSAVVPGTLLPAALATPVAPWRAARPRRVGWAVGAALVARTETLLRLGPFSNEIFLYGEDLDLGLRASRAGIETWFCPQARVLHHRAHSTRGRYGGEAFDVLARARREAVAANLGQRGLLVDDLSQGLTFGLRTLVKLALGRSPDREQRQLQSLLRARAGRPEPRAGRWRGGH